MKDKVTEDTRFYISSYELDAKSLISAIRKHWLVENALHWILGVTFNGDHSHIGKDASSENLAIIRHMA